MTSILHNENDPEPNHILEENHNNLTNSFIPEQQHQQQIKHFTTPRKIYSLKVHIYLDRLQNEYIHLLTLNKIPHGELRKHVIQLRDEKLSPFTDNYNNRCYKPCIYAIKNFCNKCKNTYLCLEDIDEFIEFLYNNNYEFNTHITEMFQRNSYISNKLIGYIFQ